MIVQNPIKFNDKENVTYFWIIKNLYEISYSFWASQLKVAFYSFYIRMGFQIY